MDPIAMDAIEAERTAKLPVWARDKITRLERDIEHYQSKIAELIAPDLEGEAVVTRGYNPELPVGSERDQFRFYLPGDVNRYRHWFDVSLKGGQLQVIADRGLAVYPHASNVVHIALDRN